MRRVGQFLGTSITQSGSSNFPLGTGGNTTGNIASALNPGAQFGIQAMNGRFNALVQALNTDNRIRNLDSEGVHIQSATGGNQRHHTDPDSERLVQRRIRRWNKDRLSASGRWDYAPGDLLASRRMAR